MCVVVSAVLQTFTLERGAAIANAPAEQTQATVTTSAEVVGPVCPTAAHADSGRRTTGGIREIPVVAKRLTG